MAGAVNQTPDYCTTCGCYVCMCPAAWAKYEEAHIPTERLVYAPHPVPTKCECGSGSNEASGAHSHWCPRWVSK